ncbi:MAG: hypothetical protein K1X85_10270 [Ignavibacteria bacterium]|nr:hypothetical protein [Ignavibacteria bacterium]
MKLLCTLLILSAMLYLSRAAHADTQSGASGESSILEVVPNAYSGTTGTGTFLGPLSNAQRTYQLLIHANQLTNLVGKALTGFSMRIPASATANWPAADLTYTNYDVYLSGSVDPVNRSLTFANNIVGPQTKVRSGALFIPANSYTFGGSPNAFGPVIAFNTAWIYTGGNLLVEIRHQGFSGTSRSTDALLTSTPGYASDFSACWTGSYTGTAGSQGNFTVIQLNAVDPQVLQLTALIEGMYDAGANLMVSDTTKVYLRNSNSPYDLVDSAKGVLGTSGTGTFYFTNAVSGVNYYIVVSHRNSIDTWSNAGYSFTSNSLSFDYTTAASQAFGSNQVLKGSRYTIYSGDANKDGTIDASDLSLIDNDATNFVSGYVATDLNGDSFVDGSDYSIADNNAFLFISVIRP